ncbi:MAG: hypothetical protein ABI919_05080 [Ramlibacter sp.]
MATPNYGYEKRQKELAKKRKKEDKLKAKSDRKVGGEPDGDEPQEAGQPEGEQQSPDSPAQPLVFFSCFQSWFSPCRFVCAFPAQEAFCISFAIASLQTKRAVEA